MILFQYIISAQWVYDIIIKTITHDLMIARYRDIALRKSATLDICKHLDLFLVLVTRHFLFWNNDKVVRSPWVNINLSELASGNLVLEQDIEFSCEYVSRCMCKI